jgi:hypothetical protein
MVKSVVVLRKAWYDGGDGMMKGEEVLWYCGGRPFVHLYGGHGIDRRLTECYRGRVMSRR